MSPSTAANPTTPTPTNPTTPTPNSQRRRSPSPPAFSAKFDRLVLPLPRRPPPTALRLISGPLPHRARPKHTLPSLPRPTFYPKIHTPRTGPTPRKRANETPLLQREAPAIHLAKIKLPELRVPGYGSDSGGDSEVEGEAGNDAMSEGSSRRSSLESVEYERGRSVRGPWDHAGSIRVPFDVKAVLPPPRRVAVNVTQKV